MALPAAGFHTTARDVSATTGALNDTLAAIRNYLGTQEESELTIATGSVTSTIGMHTIDTESDAAADTLDNIIATDGFLILIRVENAARVVTLAHESGGAGQLSLSGNSNIALDSVDKYVLLQFDSGASPTTWNEVGKFGFASVAYGSITVESNAGATTITTGGNVDFSTKVQVGVFDTNGTADDAVPDHTNDHITVGSTGAYLITAQVSLSGGNNDVISAAIFKNNGATQIGPRFTRTLNSAGAVGVANLMAVEVLTAADTIELWVQNETDNDDVTIQDAALSIAAVGI